MPVGSRESLKEILLQVKQQGKVIGFTSGTFDLLHRGHVDYLEVARSKVDVLIVGVNSDASVKSYKSPERPYVFEEDRAEVVAALRCVDFAFLFDEPNNNENIRVLKPDVYFKAGDYQKEQLSSAPIVEEYGGRVEIVPCKPGYSTTSIITKIQSSLVHAHPVTLADELRPALFLDRDGTIVEHVEYLHEVDKVRLLPGVIEGLKKFQVAGYRLIVVTNQPGIGFGYFTKEDFFRVNSQMLRFLSEEGIFIDKIYFCPHTKGEGCACRKPSIGLLERASANSKIDLEKSWMVGDMTSDVELGRNFGVQTVLVTTGKGGKDGLHSVLPDIQVGSLEEAANVILKNASVG